MNIDQLLSDFDAAVTRAQLANQEDLPAWAHRRAGLVAVVKALRDEMASGTAWHAINVILGDAGAESDDIKELVKRLRAFRPTYGWPEEQATIVKQTLGDEAADALEALVAQRDQLASEKGC